MYCPLLLGPAHGSRPLWSSGAGHQGQEVCNSDFSLPPGLKHPSRAWVRSVVKVHGRQGQENVC